MGAFGVEALQQYLFFNTFYPHWLLGGITGWRGNLQRFTHLEPLISQPNPIGDGINHGTLFSKCMKN